MLKSYWCALFTEKSQQLWLEKKKKKRERENAQLENTDVITLYPNRAIEQKKRSEYFKLWEHGFGLEREREIKE